MTCLRPVRALSKGDERKTASARRRRASRFAGAAVGLLLAGMAGQARAADLLDDNILRGSFISPGYSRWEGLQLGAQIGISNMTTNFGSGTSSLTAYILRNSTLETEASPSSWTALPSNTTSGRQLGGFVGYNWQWDQLVVGFDAAYNRGSNMQSSAVDTISRQVTTSDNVTHNVTISSQASLRLLDYATARIRAGYAIGQFLPYAMIGGAAGRFNYTRSSTVTDVWTPAGGVATQFGPQSLSDAKDNAVVGGFLVGLGMDVALLPNVFLRGEWELVAFAPVGGMRAVTNTGRVGVGVRF